MARLYSRRSTEAKLKVGGKLKAQNSRLQTQDFRLKTVLCLTSHVLRLGSCILVFLGLLLFASNLYCDTPINLLRAMKISLVQDQTADFDLSETTQCLSDMSSNQTFQAFGESLSEMGNTGASAPVESLVLGIEGTQSMQYESAFVEAKEGNSERFYIDIDNSRNRIDLSNASVYSEASSLSMPLADLLDSSSFPISKIVVAQHSLTPSVTRVVLHLRQKIDPLTETSENVLRVKIPVQASQAYEKALAYAGEVADAETDTPAQAVENSLSEMGETEMGVGGPELGTDDPVSETDPQEPIPVPVETTNFAPDETAGSTPIEMTDVRRRPAIVSEIKPIYLAKTTKLEILSDGPLKIKQVKLSKGGVLLIEVFSATSSLPSFVSIDQGILREVAFETEDDELRIYISLTEPVIYDVENTDQGLVVIFQNPVLEQLVSLDVNEESISTVILMLFTQYGANIVAGSGVSGRVTAHLTDVPLKLALDEILKAEGYGYVEEDGLVRVLSIAELESMRDAEKEKAAAIAPAKPKTESRLFELKFAVATEMQQLLKELIGTEGTILTDQRTNSVIVVSSAEQLEKVAEIIQQLDKESTIKPTGEEEEAEKVDQEKLAAMQIVKRVFKLQYMDPEQAGAILQPLLSADGSIEVVEDKSKQSTQGGAGGAGGAAGAAGGMGVGTGTQLGEAIGQGGYIVVSDRREILDEIEKEITKLDVPVPQVEIEAYIVEGTLSNDSELGIDWTAINQDEEISLSFSRDFGAVITKGIIPVEKFTGILTALSNRSDLSVLSNPSITTLEGQPAMFHSGDKVPYSKIYIQEGIEQIDTVFEEVGIVLTATPYVKENDMISLMLSTSVSSEGGFTPSGQPRIATRTTRNQVLVKSGDTVAIAGLISDKNSISVSKVPIVGDIPLIGRLFSTESEVKQKSEVTVFITPRIVSHKPSDL